MIAIIRRTGTAHNIGYLTDLPRKTCELKQAALRCHRPSTGIPQSTVGLRISGALVLLGGKSGANFDRPIESCPLFLVLTDVSHRGVAWMTSSPPLFEILDCRNDRNGSMLSKKSFSGEARKIFGPYRLGSIFRPTG